MLRSKISNEHKQKVLELENDFILLQILPEIGAKIHSILHKPRNTKWLWQNHQNRLQILPLGSNYDDNWTGGWEELFPNDTACEFQGRQLPDHGELWSQPWQWELNKESRACIEVHLWRHCICVPAVVEKRILLEKRKSKFIIKYSITNLSEEAINFLWKLHPAIAISPDHQLLLPGGKIIPVDLTFSSIIGSPGPFEWPIVIDKQGRNHDLSTILPKESGHKEFVYVTDLPEGWCTIKNKRNGGEFRLSFPTEVFPYLWLFITYGGWRDLYTIVLEPCTNFPKDLDSAYKNGTCGRIEGQSRLECEITVSLQ
ncbi:MAG: DUF5107 domain-containing protein [Methanophagales archaeon]|nr:DUF5107 domain-containing protein [Methanophagales archaeon]